MCKAFSVGPGLHDPVLQRSAAGETDTIPVHTCFIFVYPFDNSVFIVTRSIYPSIPQDVLNI